MTPGPCRAGGSAPRPERARSALGRKIQRRFAKPRSRSIQSAVLAGRPALNAPGACLPERLSEHSGQGVVPPRPAEPAATSPAGGDGAPLVARVLPDVAGFDREFDYSVPPGLAGSVRPGSLVRIPLQGRKVGGWVVASPVEPPAGIALRPLTRVTGWRPNRSSSSWLLGQPGAGRAGAARCYSPLRARRP